MRRPLPDEHPRFGRMLPSVPRRVCGFSRNRLGRTRSIFSRSRNAVLVQELADLVDQLRPSRFMFEHQMIAGLERDEALGIPRAKLYPCSNGTQPSLRLCSTSVGTVTAGRRSHTTTRLPNLASFGKLHYPELKGLFFARIASIWLYVARVIAGLRHRRRHEARRLVGRSIL
jgi:hypothetical protein